MLFRFKVPQQGWVEHRVALAELRDTAMATVQHYIAAAEALRDDPEAMLTCLRAAMAVWPEAWQVKWQAMRMVANMADPGQELLAEAIQWSDEMLALLSRRPSLGMLDIRAQLQWAAGQQAAAAATARQILDQLPEEDHQWPWLNAIRQRAQQYSTASDNPDPPP